jgi:hypothetical protein
MSSTLARLNSANLFTAWALLSEIGTKLVIGIDIDSDPIPDVMNEVAVGDFNFVVAVVEGVILV